MSRTTARKRLATNTPAERLAWRRALWGAAALSVAGAAVTGLLDYLSDPNQLPIQTIRVSGTLKHLERESVEAVVAGAIDGNFFSVDMARIRDRVRELPWVDQVSVRRRWPGTLVMQVREQVPIARWGNDRLVNARGEIFAPRNAAIAAQLVRLDGPQGSTTRVMAFQRMAEAELQGIGLRIRRLQMNERREWWLEADRGLTLLLGQHEARKRLRRFVNAYRVLAAQADRRPVRVDLRYAQGFAVTWSDKSAGADRRGGRHEQNPAGSA
jgi:cell division protein FtsQ